MTTPDGPDAVAADAPAPTAAPGPEGMNAPEAAPVPATWETRPAEAAWCPPEVATHGPAWLAEAAPGDVETFSGVVAPGWRAAAASVRGRSHAHRGEHREDAFAVRTADGLVVCCAADGAGSSALSRVGAELACRATADGVVAKLAPERAYLRDLHRDELAHAVGHAIGLSVWETCRTLHDLAAASATPPSAYRCTLLVAAWYAAEADALVVTSQVGDGAIVAWRRDRGVVRLGDPDSGDFAGEVRTFVPDAQAPARASHVRVTDAAGLEAVALLTDGVDDPLHPIEQTASALWAQWSRGASAALPHVSQRSVGPVLGTDDDGAALTAWLGFERRGENDDRTAVVLARIG